MAFILKRPQGESKGIAMFTHKERPVLSLEAPVIGPLLARLRERYVTGMHWGFRVTGVSTMPEIDFHLARESTVSFAEPDRVRRFPFNSSMFAPAAFRNTHTPKHWDIISITRTANFKGTAELLQALRLVYDKRPQTKTLILCSGPTNLNVRGHDPTLYERYLALFDEHERQRCTFLLHQAGQFAFPREDMPFFLNASRVFTLFSHREGASKVIKEALLCGVPAVVRRDLEGGGRDNLGPDNSRLFSSIPEAADALLDAIEHADQLAQDTDQLAQELSETFTVPRLIANLKDYYAELGMPFEGELVTDNLSRRLPAHTPELLHPRLHDGRTNDVKSPEAMVMYLRHVLDGTDVGALSLSYKERLSLLRWSQLDHARARLSRVVHRLSPLESR